MPRLRPALFWQAASISPNLATLLPACRDLSSAINELRWIREHVQLASKHIINSNDWRVKALCERRGKGVPLQYVLGTQPFGPLEIKCRPGVLIPRPEPEAYTTHLAELIKAGSLSSHFRSSAGLNILDLCTGTGCIALLLLALLRSHQPASSLRIHGMDISAQAVRLARANVRHNRQTGRLPPPSPSTSSSTSTSISQDSHVSDRVHFSQGDIFAPLDPSVLRTPWDILICNPPYVSRHGFAYDTARSVRIFEPKLAQVPELPPPPSPQPTPLSRGGEEVRYVELWNKRPEDVFYARLLDIAGALGPRVVLFEVGDMEQAVRVVEMAVRHERGIRGDDGAGEDSGRRTLVKVEIWRDWPDVSPEADEASSRDICGQLIPIRGSGHGRSVFIVYE